MVPARSANWLALPTIDNSAFSRAKRNSCELLGAARIVTVQSAFPMHTPITTIEICKVSVPVFGPSDSEVRPLIELSSLSAHLLYRWELYRGTSLDTVYVGKASRGQDRPTDTYPKVVRDLRSSRGRRTLCADPVKWYFPRNPWGFRWIHHQLEAATNRIVNGNPSDESIKLYLFALGIPQQQLNERELEEIRTLKSIYGPDIVANGKPSMACQQRAHLDLVWTCITDDT